MPLRSRILDSAHGYAHERGHRVLHRLDCSNEWVKSLGCRCVLPVTNNATHMTSHQQTPRKVRFGDTTPHRRQVWMSRLQFDAGSLTRTPFLANVRVDDSDRVGSGLRHRLHHVIEEVQHVVAQGFVGAIGIVNHNGVWRIET